MPQTITRTPALAAAIIPTVTEKSTYSATSESRNQIHPIVGREDVEATLRPAGLRVGTMSLFFSARADAFTAFAAHRGVGLFRLVDTDVPDASMFYVVQGQLQLQLQDDLKTWQLTVGFQEVLP